MSPLLLPLPVRPLRDLRPRHQRLEPGPVSVGRSLMLPGNHLDPGVPGGRIGSLGRGHALAPSGSGLGVET